MTLSTAESSFPLSDAAIAALISQAISAARRGVRGANPLVGAVIADARGQLVATGYHAGAGTAHAEVAAIAKLPQTPAQTPLTMVVTLEPCNHHGRTGPCTQAILDAGITHLVYACPDTNPTARGGADFLRRAGVAVRYVASAEAAALNQRWRAAVAAGRPFITGKIAQSLDGKVAAADGSSQWITSAASRAHAHQVRARVDAIAVGTGTVWADNPTLTARPEEVVVERQPLRVVIGQRELPDDCALLSTDGGAVKHLRSRDLREVLQQLKQWDVQHLLVEGGPRLLGAFLAAGLIDELHLYQAPLIIGQSPYQSVLGWQHNSLDEAWQQAGFSLAGLHRLGPDVLLELTPEAASAIAPDAASSVKKGNQSS